ncbi:putative HTH-type transcriptional regulator [Aeropyrum pernix K1]|uniref:HTH-type transcriptional regulator n=1 Tax=Aeropyrum pernix (strain ATCC 700893 / DSM 11879 / JCM 9820 / NBRC 100138 / K1) TaxID=272557 RepID=Q9YAC8_AERPE|nr:multiprotein bridging factor aMBF1 [Aeropyrum pernix]BAA81021.2 putative HTH-type transcriptional regulator [Aeropyrum pernix K1]
MKQASAYCELCGAEIRGRPYRVSVEGVEMDLCLSCYMKLARSGRAQLLREARPSRRGAARGGSGGARRPRRVPLDMYDLVEDYPERIREAREARGWSTAVLAQKLRISETMLRRIESGKLKPSLDLAKRMEKMLGVKLLEPVVDEEAYYDEDYGRDYITLGDIVVVDRDEE